MWHFWIDVGGTFTDCLAVSPEGTEHFTKVLSSGKTKGRIGAWLREDTFRDLEQAGPCDGFWNGATIEFLSHDGRVLAGTTIVEYDDQTGEFVLAEPIRGRVRSGSRYELSSELLAPVLAIHQIQKIPVNQVPLRSHVDLGTTQGTNALLTRNGAKTALVATRGFRDFLRIGDQARPKLFELAIHKLEPLFEVAIEIDERVLANGTVERQPDDGVVRRQLMSLKRQGIESLAICFMFGYRFPEHERRVASIGKDLGFRSVRTSFETAPVVKIVPRGETTVLDAYLNPVISDYFDEIQNQLSADSPVRFMTSGGGLAGCSRFSGKDSVLSGPAGGVVGAARIGEQAGFGRIIGFDMGGTSTDVSRYEGVFERTFETRKAGVRIATPMLAVETVAAGGGSVCWFDGTRLQVGPQSAGADPGPACYGRGGPLAVTDINLYLGRIQREWFPFELDDEAVERKLEQLCGQLQDSGFQMTPLELASGFLEIANHNMATAIRTVSVAKGYDPAEYLLMSFGGAGSQHCCSVAERLKMKKILDHPQSSILSAVGIRMADQSSHAVQSFVGELGRDDRDALDDVYGKLTRTVGKTLIEEGFEEREILFSRALDLRYAGTESSLTIAQPSDQDFRAAFEKAHQREFGYLQERLIEITSVRVDGIVKGNRPRPIEHPHRFAPASSKVRQKIFHRDGWLEAAVFARDQLSAGYEIKGPAIVTGLHSTTIIEPDWCAKSLEQGVLLIERAQPIPHSVKADNARISNAAGGDPVQLEIFNSHFASIAEQMGVVLQKTSSSVNVKERLDFSCAIFTGSGDLVVNAPHIPVHLGAMSETVRSTIRCNPIVNSGDVFVTNDPYAGGSHLPDVTVVTPVFDSHGRHLWFWVASRSHHAEMGGMTPGSMPANATRLAEEGVLIQNFRLIEGRPSEEHGFESRDSPFGVEHFDQLRKLLTSARYPSRTPDENLADIRAQVAANQCGLNQLRQLVGQYSFATVDSFMKHVQDAAEWKTRRALEALPDGHFEFSDEMDNGQRIRLKLEKRGAELAVDFSGTDPVSNDNLNANRAIVIAATMYVMRCLINEDIPLNEGVLKPVAIVLPVCFLNPQPAADPGDSPAIVGGNVETSQRIVDVLLGALDLAAASQGTMNNWLMGDETFGYYETLGGGSGATSSSCGASAVHCHMTNTRLTDPEVLESRYPVVLREFSIRRSSGGAGVHPGGDGMIRELEFRAPVTLSLLTSRRNSQPYGGAGGRAGHAGRNLLFRDGVTKSPANGQSGASQRNATELPSRCEMEVAVGDRLRIETPGGGGWGFPPHD